MRISFFIPLYYCPCVFVYAILMAVRKLYFHRYEKGVQKNVIRQARLSETGSGSGQTQT